MDSALASAYACLRMAFTGTGARIRTYQAKETPHLWTFEITDSLQWCRVFIHEEALWRNEIWTFKAQARKARHEWDAHRTNGTCYECRQVMPFISAEHLCIPCTQQRKYQAMKDPNYVFSFEDAGIPVWY